MLLHTPLFQEAAPHCPIAAPGGPAEGLLPTALAPALLGMCFPSSPSLSVLRVGLCLPKPRAPDRLLSVTTSARPLHPGKPASFHSIAPEIPPHQSYLARPQTGPYPSTSTSHNLTGHVYDSTGSLYCPSTLSASVRLWSPPGPEREREGEGVTSFLAHIPEPTET